MQDASELGHAPAVGGGGTRCGGAVEYGGTVETSEGAGRMGQCT